MHRHAEELTERFYGWEIHGRGWIAYPYRVALEPPYSPLELSQVPQRRIDDARQHTWFSALVERITTPRLPPAEEEEVEEVLPARVEAPERLAEYGIILPEGARVTPEVVSRWIQTLTPCGPLSFEIAGNRDGVSVALAGESADLGIASQSLSSLLPEAEIGEVAESLPERWESSSGEVFSVVECGLSREFMIPLALLRSFSPDPLSPVIGVLGALPSTSFGVLQLLFEHVRAPWRDAMLSAVTTSSGKPFFADAPEITKLAGEKARSPLLAAVIRIGAKAETEGEVFELLRALLGGLSQAGSADGNELIPLSGEPEVLEADLLERATHRPGMLLSSGELLGLLHPPSESVASPALLRSVSRSKQVPDSLMEDGLYLGENLHRGETRPVRIPTEARLRHCHVVGASGTGKSTLLVRMILEDIRAGRGVAVVDPHGDLVDAVVARMPREREGDVVLFDPADPQYVVGWNILGASSELERELLASDLVGVFRRLSTSWGDQMTTVLSNAVLAFLDSRQGGTLLDLRRFLVDGAFRKAFLGTLRDSHLQSFWETEFPLLVGRKPQAPILTRLDTFLRSRRIRDLVTVRNGLNFRELVDSGKILLARLSQGAIGVENAALLGSLLVSKIHQVTLSRQEVAERDRRPFFLYVDEFHEMATPSMATLFSGMRKFGLGLIVAHQDLYQLHGKAPDVERAVLANAHTRICFRLGEQDAHALGKGMGFFTADDLMGLRIGEAICRVGSRDADFNLKTQILDEIPREEAAERRERIRGRSGERFGVRRDAEVEQEPIITSPPEDSAPLKETPVKPRVVSSSDEEMGREAEAKPQFDKETLDFLEHVALEPFLTVRERNEALGLSAWKGQQLKEQLIGEGLAREVAVNPGGRGQRFKLLELTSRGREMLHDLGVTPATGHGRGGVAHQWWVRHITEWLDGEGVEAHIEDESKGARVDIRIPLRRGDIAVEVEMGEGHVEENLRKDTEAGYKTILTLLPDPESLERILEKLGEQTEGIHVAELRDYEAVLARLLTPSSLRRANQDQEPRRRVRRRRSSPAPQKARPMAMVTFEDPGAYTTPLAAEYLGLSPATLETMRVRGGGPVFVKLGRRVVYRREDLDSWLEERRRTSTSDAGEGV